MAISLLFPLISPCSIAYQLKNVGPKLGNMSVERKNYPIDKQ